MLFSYFRFFAIPHAISEFECNGGFSGLLSKKLEEARKEDRSFGTGSNAAVHDTEGYDKFRRQHVF